MALRVSAAFVAGAAVGWALREVLGSTREAAVHVIVVAHEVRDFLVRVLAEQREHLEDLFAEGRARSESQNSQGSLDADAVPSVVTHGAAERVS